MNNIFWIHLFYYEEAAKIIKLMDLRFGFFDRIYDCYDESILFSPSKDESIFTTYGSGNSENTGYQSPRIKNLLQNLNTILL